MSSYRTYRAPTEHGEALIEPSLDEAKYSIANNQASAASWGLRFGELSLQQLRELARRELIHDALHYTRAYRDAAEPRFQDAIVMAGHQPSLFHPGVWFKNFALDSLVPSPLYSGERARVRGSGDNAAQPPHPSPLYRKAGGEGAVTAINLVIDNDVASSSAIRVPVIDPKTGYAHQESVIFDAAAGGVPYEQNRIRDRAIFDSFADRVCEVIHRIIPNPLVNRLWTYARAAAARCENVSCALAQARHALEGELGLQTLELPLSVVCRSESFAAFALSIIGELPRFRELYNSSLKQYRIEHGIRSRAHPVPELGVQDEWTEAPFWIYGDDSPQRLPAYVRKSGASIEISDLRKRTVRLTSPANTTRAVAELAAHGGPNYKLRPRALMTTMYARMILSDLFIHGIGGAKYDQLGDQIMQRFFAIEPPAMMVVSATVQLPLAGLAANSDSVEQVKQQIRTTRFAPELFAGEVNLPQSLLDQKRQLLEMIPERGSKRAWHDELASINRSLESQLAGIRSDLELRLLIAKQNAMSATILRSREYSFCLFDLDELRKTFAAMLSG